MVVAMADVRPTGRARVSGPTATGAPKSRLDGRVRVLVEIAERFQELVDPLSGSAGLRGDGESVGLMPRTYTPSVREFERLVLRLREERHSKWWHLNEFWLQAESRTVWWCSKCKRQTHQEVHDHGTPDRVLNVSGRRQVVWSRHRNADRAKALVAIEWMAVEWSLGSEPMLPDEIRVAA